MPPRVHVITTVGGAGVAILPQCLNHYRAMGVESFFVILHLQRPDEAQVARVREMTASCGIGIESVVIERDFHHVRKTAHERIMRSRPDDWFLPVDADEFPRYPEGLHATLADCDRHGYEYVWGMLVDRLSPDGALTPLQPRDSVWMQYPLGGFITWPLLGGDPRKIVAVKGRVRLGVGNHAALDGIGCPIDRHIVPIHHFKWVGTLIPYLQKRSRDYQRLKKPWWTESERCVQYFARHRRLDLSNPRFFVSACDPHYREWHRVVDVIRGMNARVRNQAPRDAVVGID